MTAYDLHIARWWSLAMPDDVAQEIALAAFLGRTQAQRKAALRYRLRELRRTQWDRTPRRPAPSPACLRPSKIASITGYRTNSAAHREARLHMDTETRRAIARKGARARWSEENFLKG